jgi:addiction module RelE/StbE family toxin
MPNIVYTPKFIRQWNKLIPDLQDEVIACLDTLKINPQDPGLKTHKLSGALKGCLSCSVNYHYRIVFEWDTQETIAVLSVGDHDVYR